MIVDCLNCSASFDDEFRTTICPHGTFAANDGKNNFAHHPESHLSEGAGFYGESSTLPIEEQS